MKQKLSCLANRSETQVSRAYMVQGSRVSNAYIVSDMMYIVCRVSVCVFYSYYNRYCRRRRGCYPIKMKN